jgi:D-sedoheptulose 7-phosphate isomerase
MMGPDAAAGVEGVIAESVRLHEQAKAASVGPTAAAATAMTAALRAGGKVLVFGNGGSASDAQHFAAELVGRFVRERRAIPAVALTTDTSILTAIGNDYGFDRVFSRQIEALGRAGDVALGITTSGASANVVAALDLARAAGLVTVALTGRDGGLAGRAADIHVNVPSSNTARVQEVHRTLLHAICELVERDASA